MERIQSSSWIRLFNEDRRCCHGLSFLVGLFDNGVVDGAVNGSGWTAGAIGSAFASAQTGRVRNYIFGAGVGVALLVLIFVFVH